jgi:hypothetical protein
MRHFFSEGVLPPDMSREFLSQLQTLDQNLCPLGENLNVEAESFAGWYEDQIGSADTFRKIINDPAFGFDESVRQAANSLTPQELEAQVSEFIRDYRGFVSSIDRPYYEVRDLPVEQMISDNIFSREILPFIADMPAVQAHVDAERLGIATTLALEMYRQEQGAYPGSLDALSPDYLQLVPKDPFTNKPFVYHTTDDGYTLYSVGKDAEDNGGATDDWDEDNADLILH